MATPDPLRKLVETALERVLSRDNGSSSSTETPDGSRPSASVPGDPEIPGPRNEGLITERDVMSARDAGVIRVRPGSIVTPAARDTAERYNVRFEQGAEPSDNPAALRRIAIGADHGGYAMKEALKRHLVDLGYNVQDVGCHSTDSVDYPDYAVQVAARVSKGDCSRGILIDGAGIGSCMTANKVPGVLAANCQDAYSVRNSREHNNANVLCLGSGVLNEKAALDLVKIWLETPFGGGRHGRRVDKIRRIERMFLAR